MVQYCEVVMDGFIHSCCVWLHEDPSQISFIKLLVSFFIWMYDDLDKLGWGATYDILSLYEFSIDFNASFLLFILDIFFINSFRFLLRSYPSYPFASSCLPFNVL